MIQMRYPVIDPVATGHNIRQLREARGLSVRDLQAFFGFEEPRAIYKWQTGQTLPSVDNLYALGALLGVPMEEILVSRSPKLNMVKEQQAPVACCSVFFALRTFRDGKPVPYIRTLRDGKPVPYIRTIDHARRDTRPRVSITPHSPPHPPGRETRPLRCVTNMPVGTPVPGCPLKTLPFQGGHRRSGVPTPPFQHSPQGNVTVPPAQQNAARSKFVRFLDFRALGRYNGKKPRQGKAAIAHHREGTI